jgi:hypothetical protein
MKKLTIITSLVAMTTLGSMAQGIFSAQTGSTTIFITVSDPNIAGGAATKIGSPANAAGFSGVGPGQVTFQSYIGTDGESLAALLASTPFYTTTVTNSGNANLSTAQGTAALGNPFTLPNVPGVNDGTKKVEVVFTAIGTEIGLNPVYMATTSIADLTPGTTIAQALFGSGAGQIASFNLVSVPEPTTMALGGLGAAALLYFRRRK